METKALVMIQDNHSLTFDRYLVSKNGGLGEIGKKLYNSYCKSENLKMMKNDKELAFIDKVNLNYLSLPSKFYKEEDYQVQFKYFLYDNDLIYIDCEKAIKNNIEIKSVKSGLLDLKNLSIFSFESFSMIKTLIDNNKLVQAMYQLEELELDQRTNHFIYGFELDDFIDDLVTDRDIKYQTNKTSGMEFLSPEITNELKEKSCNLNYEVPYYVNPKTQLIEYITKDTLKKIWKSSWLNVITNV